MRQKIEPSWSLLDLPTGPQPTPPWARDLHVNWMDGYGNPPSFKLKTNCNARDWDDQRFERIGSMWITRHADGRAEIYYQGGPLQQVKVKRWRNAETGSLHQYGQFQPGSRKLKPGEWIEVERWATRQEEGFGGTHIDITMTDGREVTLRGPWHGGPPNGYVETSYIDTTKERFGGKNYWSARPWYGRGGRAGLFIAEPAFVTMFARFQPHLRLARISDDMGDRVQPLKSEWDAPKQWILKRERSAA